MFLACYLRAMPGHPCRIRRRGEALREAVFVAALAEIAEVGVRGASMDRIAQRAGTGKACLLYTSPSPRD